MRIILKAANARNIRHRPPANIILASGSPRRKRLLRKIVRSFTVRPARISERLLRGEGNTAACMRLAEAKARASARRSGGAVVIGADTIAYRGKKIYRKTGSARTALRILLELSGRAHYVVTGVAVVFPGGKCVKYFVRAAVRMKKLTPKMLESYLKSGEWKGRAGSYDVSGKGKRLVERVKGERETVVGLPLKKLRLVLKK
ncbi:MAG: Maf family protein [Candidatus Micrarchaeota archaeon]|nr:Maf family protein [Candidatus Micrarchaeota archaeon]